MLFEFCFAFDVSKSEFLDVLVAYENPLDAWCEAETILELEGIVSAYIYAMDLISTFSLRSDFAKPAPTLSCADASMLKNMRAAAAAAKMNFFIVIVILIMCFLFKCPKYSVLLSNGKISQRMSIKLLPNGESASQNEQCLMVWFHCRF